MKKILLLSALTATVFADEEIAAMDSYSRPSTQQQPTMNVVALTSAAPDSSNGWYVFADALLWHADVGSTDWAFKNDNLGANKTVGRNHSLNFKWAWGFRAGLGANMNHDAWDTNVYYTWFHTENSNAVGGKAPAGSFDEQTLAGSITSGEIEWRIHYEMLDWELGRWFYVSKMLAVRPHVGVKGGWIDQKVDSDFRRSDGTDYDVNRRNDFWGVGPAGGVNTSWKFGSINSHHFGLVGDFAGALMYGHFNVRHDEKIKPIEGHIGGFKPSHLNRNLAVAMLQAFFGFSWDTAFNRDRCHIGVRAGYELQYWFRQNQLLVDNAHSEKGFPNYRRISEDLALQGLTFDFKFDF